MTTPADRSRRIERLVRRRQNDPRTHTFAELADLYLQEGELETALIVVEDGLRHHPHFLNARLVHARLLSELGHVDQAAAAFRQVLEIDSENTVALDAIGELRDGVTDMRKSDRSSRDGGAAQWLAGLDRDWRNGGDEEPVRTVDDQESPEAAGPAEGREPEEGSGEAPAPLRASERRAADDLETATLARLYVSQGLFDQAIGIYERLLARDPYNARLAAALEEARQRSSKTGTGVRSRGAAPPARPARPESAPVRTGDRAADAPVAEDQVDDLDEPTIAEFLGTLLNGRAEVGNANGSRMEWPDWLTALGTEGTERDDDRRPPEGGPGGDHVD